MLRFDRIPLRFKLVSSVVAVLVPIALFIFFYYPYRQRRHGLQTVTQETKTLAQLVSMGVGIAMRAGDYTGVIEAMSWVKRDPSIQYVVVADSAGRGRPFATYNPRKLTLALPAVGDSSQVHEVAGGLSAATPIVVGGKTTGTLFLGVSLASLEVRMQEERRVALMVSLGILLFGSAIAWLFAQRISRPVVALRAAADRIAAGDYGAQVETKSLDEVGVLGQAFNLMAGQIRTVFQQLADQAVELEKARDAAMTAANAKAEFLATMSHELRTPMNGVLGMLDLALEGDLPGEERERVRVAYQSAEALLHILNDILDVSRIESGKLSLEAIDFDLRDLVDEVAQLLRPSAEDKGLSLGVLVGEGVPAAVRGDPGRTRQILTNLVGNAVKFSNEGEVAVRVRMVDEVPGQVRVRFEIADTGIGISEEAQSRLFQPFSQADTSTTRKFGGTGLGLTICRRLVELMGGEIGVKSTPGEGSLFWFTVLLAKASTSTVDPSLKPDLFRGCRVLVLDDEAAGRAVLVAHLAAWGFEVTDVETPDEARAALVQAAAARPFQLAIFDFQMPGGDGISVARELRSDKSFAAIPFVLLSSAPQRGQARAAREAGFAAYLPKPVRASRLLDCLSNVLTGTCMTASVPASLPKQGGTELRASTGLHVLVVEDNEINQKIAVAVLQKLGHEAAIASDGIEGVAAVEQGNYDLVLMDCQMPRLDGFEATRRIRQAESPSYRIPIIAMTANAMPGDRERCLSAGMDDYLTKPMNRARLAETIARWVPHSRSAPVAPSPTEAVQLAHLRAPSPPEAVELDHLRALVGNAPADLTKYLRLFLTSGRDLVADIAKTAAARDANLLRRSTHTLRGSAATVGANRTAQAAAAIDAAALDLNWVEVEHRTAELQIAFTEVEGFIEATFPAAGQPVFAALPAG